jgi:hypothetical protein
MIPIPPDINYELYRRMGEMRFVHNTIELELYEEIRLLNESLRIANEQRDLAFEDAREAEEIARNINSELHNYKLEQNARNVVEKKQQRKDNWAKWSASIKK